MINKSLFQKKEGLLEKIAESVVEFAKAIFQGNKIALAILLGLLLFILSIRFSTSKPIELPIQAHNTIGNLPIVETFDDGDTNKEDQGVEIGHDINDGNFYAGFRSSETITFR